MMRRLVFPWGLLALVSACVVESEQYDLRGQDVRLTVLHTADWHSRLIPYVIDPPVPQQALGLLPENAPYGGAARMMTMLKQERARSERTIHVDSGDCFQGAPIFNSFFGEPELKAMTLAGVDAMVIGNHEFDRGADAFVEQAAKWAGFPFLAANYDLRDPKIPGNNGLASVAQDVVIINRDGLKILVIGLANISSLTSIGQGGNSLQITPYEPNEVTQRYIELYSGSVDLIFVVSHMGLEVDEAMVHGYNRVFDLAQVDLSQIRAEWDCDVVEAASTAVCKVPPVRGLDVIFGGHLHTVLNPPRVETDIEGREVLIVHSGAFMQFVGRLDVVTREATRMGRPSSYGREILSHKYKPLPVDSRLAPDPLMERLLAPYQMQLALDVDLRRPVAWAMGNLTRTNPNGGDSQMGNLVATAMLVRQRVKSDFAVTNSLGIRDNLNQGTITLEELYNVFPFENTITTMYLSGREVQELVDFASARAKSRGCKTQAQVANISYTMRCDCDVSPTGCCDPAHKGPVFACGEDVKIGGTAINPNGTYQLGTNDYIATGGSGFTVLKRNTTQQNSFIPLRTAMEEYLQSFPACDEAAVELSIQASEASSPEEGARLRKEWNEIRQFGVPACVDGSGLVDGRIKRRVGG